MARRRLRRRSGQAAIAYRDVHFGFAVSDLTAKSDVELAEQQGGGGFSVLTVDVSRGGGTYDRVAFTLGGPAARARAIGPGGCLGGRSSISHSMSGGLGAQEADGGWTSSEPFQGQVGPQLGFAVSAQGLMGLAYFDSDPSVSRLFYIESHDGVTWSTAAHGRHHQRVTGSFPSLAFDASGNPAIAYYRCSASVSVMQCDPAQDGLYLARRSGAARGARRRVAVEPADHRRALYGPGVRR